MSDDTPVALLVTDAQAGSSAAWSALVERYASLVWCVCRRHRLSSDDSADVSQTVWLRLVERLDDVREPEALAGWLMTTTRRECLRVISRGRRVTLDFEGDVEVVADVDLTAPDRDLLRQEREQVVLAAVAQLPRHLRELIMLLIEDPPRSYSEISLLLGMPIGSIGPTRARCMDRLRQTLTHSGYVDARPSAPADGK